MKLSDAICKRHIYPIEPIPTGVKPDLSKMQQFSALLFDVYGTLLVSGAGDIGQNPAAGGRMGALLDLLQRYGINRTPQHLPGDLNAAIRNDHRIQRHKGVAFPEVDIVEVWSGVLGLAPVSRVKHFALEYELIANPVYAMPALDDLLSACKNRNIPTGIISNAQFYTVLLLEWFLGGTLETQGLDGRLLFFSWREGHAKPSTIMFEQAKKILASMGVPAKSVLYVGNDMLNDVLPAASVGFRTALFAGDRRSLRRRANDHRCKDLRPDLIVTDLRQLIAATGNLLP